MLRTLRQQDIASVPQLDRWMQKVCLLLPDKADRARMIYYWVTHHISYDFAGVYPRDSAASIDLTLKRGEAICSGYTSLFRYMCRQADIPCISVAGFGRNGVDMLRLRQDSLPVNHAWNVMEIHGQAQLVDPTWGAGYLDRLNTEFTPSENDWYFCTPPQLFILEHFPLDSTWQLLSPVVSPQQFVSWPLVEYGFTESRIRSFSPAVLQLEKRVGDTILFRFRCEAPVTAILITSRINKKIFKTGILHERKGYYEYVYTVQKPGAYDLQVDLMKDDFFSNRLFSYIDIVYWLNVRPREENRKQRARKEKKGVF